MKNKIINKLIDWIDDYGHYFSWETGKQILIILVSFYLLHSATHWIF
jgi:adenine-specific DNA glycosylase